MAYTNIETPRTEVGDRTYLTQADGADLDFSTVNSIPSPSRDSNDLVRHLRGMRAPTTSTKHQTTKTLGANKDSPQGRNGKSQSPRSRLPLMDRRNAQGPSKAEFTPLLKSATRNQQARTNFNFGKENQMQTPMALKANYHIGSSPPLPMDSSMMRLDEEEFTGSELADEAGGRTPIPPMSSSSAMSTPAILKQRTEAEIREKGGNLATLREQEARLEQIDKENFSLKLRIHFLEESMRKSGKEFNEAALRENTELKVDKVQLQRDLRQHRKLLTQAERDLEQYRRELTEYIEKFKHEQGNEEPNLEVQHLRTTLEQKEEKIAHLQERVDSADDKADNLEPLQEKISDLEQEVRDRDRQLDDKENELDRLQEKLDSANDDGAELDKLEAQLADLRETVATQDKELDELRQDKSRSSATQTAVNELQQQLQEREDEIESFRDALRNSGKEQDRRLAEKDRQLEEKEDELRELEEQLKSTDHELSMNARTRDTELSRIRSELDTVQNALAEAHEKAADSEQLRRQLEKVREKLQSTEGQTIRLTEVEEQLATLQTELRKKNRAMEEQSFEVDALQAKLDVARTEKAGESPVQKLEEQIEELQQELREEHQRVQEKEDIVDDLQEKIQDLHNAQDDELIEAQDRIKELEEQESRNLRDLQALRNNGQQSPNRSMELQQQKARVTELEDELANAHRMRKQLEQDADSLQSNIEQLEKKLKDKDRQLQSSTDDLEDRLHAMELSKSRVEQRCNELQSTIDILNQSGDVSADRESALKQALDNERKYFKDQEQRLDDDIRRLTEKLEHQATAAHTNGSNIADKESELKTLRETESTLTSRVEALEDELEVLQIQADEDAERAHDDVEAAKSEAVNIRRQLQTAQLDLAKAQTEGRDLRLELELLCSSGPQAQRHLSTRCELLVQQVSSVTEEREALRAELVGLKERHKTSELPTDLQARLNDAEIALSQNKQELSSTKDQLAITNTECNSLQKALADLEDAHDKAKNELREAQAQFSRQQREIERKMQNRVSEYENDIQNLEQDLADTQSAEANASKRLETADKRISQLKARIANLEGKDVTKDATYFENTADQGKPASPTTAAERKNLHAMLKDAYLQAEDLQRQMTERETHWKNVQQAGDEIRDQLKRVRSERSAASQRADETSAQLREMQNAYKALQDDLAVARASHQKAVRFQQSLTSSESKDGQSISSKQHTSELRGLVRQIEYLSRRLKREERFRADLAHTKRYFQKVVDTHARCTDMDLRLVEEMGIPARKIQLRERSQETFSNRSSPPSFKALAQTVRACIRMSRSAKEWQETRARHDVLLKKLSDMKKRRNIDVQNRDGKGQKRQPRVTSSKPRN